MDIQYRSTTVTVSARYADLADHSLAVALSTEDAAEEHGLDPFERTTCYAHRRWLHQCVSSPLHVVRVSGHRWCRRCECAVTVAVDELVGDLTLTCPRCGQMPPGPANRQVVRACRASLAAASEAGKTGPDPTTQEDTMTEAKRWTVDTHIDEHEDRTRARARLHNRDETGLVGIG